MPRKLLLGREDPPYVKRLRAFTLMAEQEIYDIGNPPGIYEPLDAEGIKRKKKRNYRTKGDTTFRLMLEKGEIPLVRDHSASLNCERVIWQVSYCDLDLNFILPRLLLGVTDPDNHYSKIAVMGIVDLFRHCQPKDILAALPEMMNEFKVTFRSSNDSTIRRLIKILTDLVTIIDGAVVVMHPFLTSILYFLDNYASKNTPNMNSGIYYKQKKEPFIYEVVQDLLMLLEDRTEEEKRIETVKLIKKAVPSYDSPFFLDA